MIDPPMITAPTVAPSTPTPIDRAFFARDAETVARALVGATLAVAGAGSVQRVRIVETEAYVGAHDLACHAARGRTARTAIMFGPAGHAYVYLIYGLHHLLNVVTGPAGDAQAVLLRAAEVVRPDQPLDVAACRGPGLLTRHLGVTRADDGHNVCPTDAPVGARLWFEDGTPPGRLATSARIGVDYAGPWAAAPLRFFDPDSRAVSRARPSHPAARAPVDG
jgi:DNA-3-methyladenine glycosylase